MRNFLIHLSLMVTLLMCPVTLAAQSSRPVSADEYIQSRSPTNSGGRITSGSIPGTANKKWTTIEELPVRNEDTRVASNTNSGSSPFRQASFGSQRVSTQRPAQYDARNSGTYPYPGAANPRTARLTPSETAAAATTASPSNASVRRTAFQGAGLNSNSIRTAQNCNCQPGYGGYQAPANYGAVQAQANYGGFQAPANYGGFQTPAATIPSLNIQQPAIQAAPVAAPQGRLFVPGTDVNGQNIGAPTLQFPSTGYGAQASYGQDNCGCPPGYNAGGGYGAAGGYGAGGGGLFGGRGGGIFGGNGWFRNWWRPLLTGNGAYQPVLDFGGLQAGTYLGKGIIGQPTAYVGSQPVRNILRYLTP